VCCEDIQISEASTLIQKKYLLKYNKPSVKQNQRNIELSNLLGGDVLYWWVGNIFQMDILFVNNFP